MTPIPRGNHRLAFPPIHGDKWTIHPARYARGKACIHAPSLDGFKTRAARLAEGCGGRWTGRDSGYVLSPAAAERFQRLYAAGWDASPITRELIEPRKV